MLRFIVIILVIGILGSGVVMAQGESVTNTFEYDGRTRTYQLYVPSEYDAETPIPLVMSFHPAGATGYGMALVTNFENLAEEDTVLLVYPDGPGGYWDYGAGTPAWENVPDLRDDPSFASALLDELLDTYMIDPEQIYMVGFSNGARMAMRMACSDLRVAGMAAVSATISDEVTAICDPDAEFDAIYFHGRLDGTTPWAGKPLYIGSDFVSNALSAPDTAQFFADVNDCSAESVADDGAILYENCNGGQVIFYGVEDQGHLWFDDPDTTQLIWDFFDLKSD